MNDMLSSLISISGWIDTAELLVTYSLVSKGMVANDSLEHQAFNATGSMLLTVDCTGSGAQPSVITNALYLLVGLNILFTMKWAYTTQLSCRQTEGLRPRMYLRRHPSPAVSAGFVE